jgi:MinD superfamily P-loop ATPase
VRQLVVISGKGGTGKTTVTASFVALARRPIIADADVEAPNQHLLLHPQVQEKHDFKGAKLAVKDAAKCDDCGQCQEHCRFQAIQELEIDPTRCEGCGVCVAVCPTGALHLEDVVTGAVMTSKTEYGSFAHALLDIGAEGSGKLVTEVRRSAEGLREKEPLLIIDGSPGIGCPVIASLSGTDLALIVTEPSVSGRHDLERVFKVTQHFGVEALVCINKWDLCPEMSKEIENYCDDEGVEVVGRIPFDPGVLDVIKQGLPVEALLKTRAGEVIAEIWDTVNKRLFWEDLLKQ